MSAHDFEVEMDCLECGYKFWADLDEKPMCPKCKGVKIVNVEVDEPDPEA